MPGGRALLFCGARYRKQVGASLGIDHNSSLTALYHLTKLLTLRRSPQPLLDAQRAAMNFEVARTQMLGQQLRAWEVLDERVLSACHDTPREQFVPREYRDLAFADIEIPLGHGESTLAPKIEGRLLQALQVQPIDDVLVVGTGSGYLTACLSRLGKSVTSIDLVPEFVHDAARKFVDHDINNVEVHVADAFAVQYVGRFDAIALTGSVPALDSHFIQMLRPEGRLFAVVGGCRNDGAAGGASGSGLLRSFLRMLRLSLAHASR